MAILLVVFVISFIIGVPVAFCLGLSGLASLVFDLGGSASVIVSRLYSSMDSFPLLAIPLFVLMGQLLDKCGVLSRLSDFLVALLRPIKGGLAHVNVLLSMLFAGVSGTAVADIAAMGYLEVKMMEDAGYDKDFSAALTAASSICGPIIPPSVGMVLFALAVGGGVSIGGLFMAGIVPGLILGITMMITSVIVIKKRNMNTRIKTGEKVPVKTLVKLGLNAWPILLLPVIILGGIMFGIFTVTEAATVGCIYSLFVGFVVTKELRFSDIPLAIINAAVTTGTVAILFGAGNLVSWLLTVNQIPTLLAELITANIHSDWLFLIFVTIFLGILGCFMDATAAIILMAPILYPIALSFEIPVFTFGVIFTMTLMIGMITPPVGVALFVTSSVTDVKINALVRSIIPYVIQEFAVVFLLIFIPGLTVWLPKVLGFG